MPRPKRPDAPGFGGFTAPSAAIVSTMDRARYGALTPAQAAKVIIADYHAMRPLAETTRRQKEVEFRKMLSDLGQKGFDLATVTPTAMTEYRAYLQSLVTAGTIDEDYAYNLVKDWNAMANLLFNERGKKPGESLKMKGFKQTAKVVDHITVEDMEAMLAQLANRKFLNAHYREATRVFLELGMSSAARFSSIAATDTLYSSVNWTTGTIKFRTVKNREQHEALLTDRALDVLRRHRQFLIASQTWKGDDATPILVGPGGMVVSYTTINNALHDLAELAGIEKNVTTHVPRKSVGTHMGKDNPRMAREQLGITQKIFEKNYNQPTLEDRIDRRDLLPGAGANRAMLERLGALLLNYRKGQIGKEEFEREVNRQLLAEAPKTPRRGDEPGYG